MGLSSTVVPSCRSASRAEVPLHRPHYGLTVHGHGLSQSASRTQLDLDGLALASNPALLEDDWWGDIGPSAVPTGEQSRRTRVAV